MVRKKIVLIRGVPTSGKTTMTHELAKVLPGWIFIDIWKIKEMFEPLGMKDRRPLKKTTKKAVHVIMREVMKDLGVDIIVQESERSVLNKKLGSYLKKYNYEIYSFFLHVDLDKAAVRDRKREKPDMKMKKLFTRDQWEKMRKTHNKGDVIIDTGKKSMKEVIDIMLKEIGEKKEKHPNAHAIRKTW
jgi:cytidylate kinase